MSQTLIQFPPSVGGGDVVMCVLTTGKYEDILKATAKAPYTETLAELVQASIVTFRGKPLPVGGDREAWWRELDVRLRACIIAYYKRLNEVDSEEIDSFFAAAERVKSA